MKLPIYLSIPHSGMRIPPEVKDLCILGRQDILADYDKGADFIYSSLKEYAAGCATTDISRSIIDLNRAPDDIGSNGVVREHTFQHAQIYRKFPDEGLINTLLERYYFPYHEKLKAAAFDKTVRLGIDCHTMAAVGPPVSPDPGQRRPLVCLSNSIGTCPVEWIRVMADCLGEIFNKEVSINAPFRGGHIIQFHCTEMPWLQIEISQSVTFSNEFKRDCVLAGLQSFCNTVLFDG